MASCLSTRSTDGGSAVITAGGTGIGAATARRLASLGAHVVVRGPDERPLAQIAADAGESYVVGDEAVSEDLHRGGLRIGRDGEVGVARQLRGHQPIRLGH